MIIFVIQINYKRKRKDVNSNNDPMGMAIADFHNTGKAGRLKVFSPMFEKDEIPLSTLFRSNEDTPKTLPVLL